VTFKINFYISSLVLIISSISFIGFGFYDLISDHFLRITNESIHFYLLYLFNSFVSFLAYNLGPWVIAPSLILFLLFFRNVIRMNIFSSIFFQIGFWVLSFGLVGAFFPSLLGKPLLSIFSNLSSLTVIFSIFGCFIFSIWSIDKNNFVLSFIRDKIFNILFDKFNIFSKEMFYLINRKFKFPSSITSEQVASHSSSSDYSNKKILSNVFPKRDSITKKIERTCNNSTNILPNENSSKLDSKRYNNFKASSNKVIKHRSGRTRKRMFNDYFESVNLKPGKRNSIVSNMPGNDYFQGIINRIEDKLLEFKIDGKIINILKGPVVDTFELELGSGVKVSKVTSSVEDLSLALYGAPIRIVYPMKGRTTVGIEVPRNPREVIYLDELLNTKEFKNSTDRLPLAMGKDAFGLPFIVDLVGMPHMLVAGATGAGKSVFINTILVSLLVKKTPEEMRLILIDPKQLELALYATLPHLIMPVVTDAKRASLSLLWAVDEMERRYSILKEIGVRNIDGYNDKLSNDPRCIGKIQHLFKDEQTTYKLPYLVIIVDEFADLILTKAGKEIENNICRLAAKARAAGIHLIIATQRPSVDVITGLIKSNFPTRVSFRVTTSIDSRTILNSVGAERLLGKGDMLYKHGVETSRVHSSYVDEVEIEKLTYSLAQFETGFDEEVIEFLENGGEKEKDPYSFGSHLPVLKGHAEDDLFGQAVEIVTECRSASASMLQRRLKVGYNRAANLVELMEEKGIVGPAQGSKPRKVLISSK
jgi:DNA segregation ATPase FtsK/SpoIIIE, S-DNA-T family